MANEDEIFDRIKQAALRQIERRIDWRFFDGGGNRRKPRPVKDMEECDDDVDFD